MTVLEAIDLGKTYIDGDGGALVVLDGVNLRVDRGEMVAIIGSSGTGKSTLLHLLGALDRPTRGRVIVAGTSIGPADADAAATEESRSRWSRFGGSSAQRMERDAVRRDGEISRLRNRSIGFVFQFHHLLREFSALENVMMPLRVAGWDEARARTRGSELLGLVGLAGRMSHRPGELSGGEQQRTAVARALAVSPQVLLADEPSGNLDHANGERLHDLLAHLSEELAIAMVIVTHNRSLAARAHRLLLMEDGRLHDGGLQEAVP